MYYVRPASIAGLNVLSLSDQIAAATAATARTGRDPDEPRRKWHILREVARYVTGTELRVDAGFCEKQLSAYVASPE
jgi:hypothetical protein